MATGERSSAERIVDVDAQTFFQQMLERRARLMAERQSLIAQHEELGAHINAFNGAIEECEHWLRALQVHE